MSEAIPSELKSFLAQHIESLAQLEALLAMREDAARPWAPAELAQRLYITGEMCQALLANLEQRGFARREADGSSYHYRAPDDNSDRLLGELGQLYQHRRVAVITEIYSKPVDKAQTFADAFRLRREQ